MLCYYELFFIIMVNDYLSSWLVSHVLRAILNEACSLHTTPKILQLNVPVIKG